MPVVPIRKFDIDSINGAIETVRQWNEDGEIESLVCVALSKSGDPLLTHSISSADAQRAGTIGAMHMAANHLAETMFRFEDI